MLNRIEMYPKILLSFIISFSVSEGLFSEPDLSNPLLPLRLRQMCGYHYRPFQQNISYNNKCFIQTFEDKMAFNPIIESNSIHSSTHTRVLGGVNAEYRESPWTVQISIQRHDDKGLRLYFACTGVLITKKHILTAAHCQKSINNTSDQLFITMGLDIPLVGTYYTNRFEFYPHPNYTSIPSTEESRLYDHFIYDIAIIVLDVHVDFEVFNDDPKLKSSKYFRMNTICLPLPEESPWVDSPINNYENATYFGWGLTDANQFPTWLQKADVQVRRVMHQDTLLNQYMLESLVNALPRSCGGDSGGGLIQYLDDDRTRAVLIGIVRGGVTKRNITLVRICDEDDSYLTLFVRVDKHIDWIYEMLDLYQ